MNKEQAKAYATVTLDLLFKMKVKITPMALSEQMELIYDLYDLDEIISEYSKIKNNKTFVKSTSSKANCYIVNVFNTADKQRKDFEEYCKKAKIEIGETYITDTKSNSEVFYKLIKDIRNKEMGILILNTLSYYSIPAEELAAIVRICRKNNILIIEI